MLHQHLALTAHPHDRLGVRRKDDAWLARSWADPSTRVLVVAGARVRLGDEGLTWISPQAAPDGVRVLLGERDGVVRWAVLADPDEVAAGRDAGDWLPLRGLLPVLEDDLDEAPFLFHAMGLAEWHLATHFCPRCGGGLRAAAAGHELVCTGACGRAQFPRTDPAVIMLISRGEPGSDEEECLLGRHPAWPPGRFSTLAGFCEPGESLEDAVRREVAEETGVGVGEVTYFGNQPWPLPASLMLGFHGRATTSEITVDAVEIEAARWWSRRAIREEAADGSLVLPGGVSISRSLVEDWYGGTLPGRW